MAFPLVQDEVQGDYSQAPNTTWDSIKATGINAIESGPTGFLANSFSISDLENKPNQRLLTVPELTSKYPGVTWTEPKKEEVAKYIAHAREKKSALENRINMSDSSLLGSIGRFAAGNIADPIADLGFAATGGAFRAAGILEGGLGASMARGALEGATAMTPIEAAQMANDRMLENDVSLTDAIKGVAIGGALGAGLEAIGHGYKEFKKNKLERVKPPLGDAAKPEHNAQTVDVAARQMAEGLRPNIEPLVKLYEDQRQAAGPKPETDYSNRSSYEFTPIDTHDPVSGEFFHGNTSGNENFHDLNFASNVNSLQHFGDGIYLNDNAMKANGYAEKGLVHEVKTKDARLFPVDQPITKGMASIALEALGEKPTAEDINGIVNDGLTLKDAYENMTVEERNKVNMALKNAGYDGLHFEDSAKDGSNKSNGVMLFDKSKVEPTSVYNSDPGSVAGLSEEGKKDLANAHDNPENKIGYDANDEKAVEDYKQRAAEHAKTGADTKFIDEGISLVDKQLKALKENGMLLPEHETAIAEIEAAAKGEIPEVPTGEKLEQVQDVVKNQADVDKLLAEIASRDKHKESIKHEMKGSKVIDQYGFDKETQKKVHGGTGVGSGEPLMVFHGTGKTFQDFSADHLSEGASDISGRGFYFAEDVSNTGSYTHNGSEPNIRPAFLKINNPIYWQNAPTPELMDKLRRLFKMGDEKTEFLVDNAINMGETKRENGKWAYDLRENMNGETLLLKDGSALTKENFTDKVLKPLGFDGAYGTAAYSAYADRDQWIAFDKDQIIHPFDSGLMPPPAKPEMVPVKIGEGVVKAMSDCMVGH